MADNNGPLQGMVESIIDFVVLIVLGIISFYITVFVIITGANLAEVTVAGNYVVLSAALIVAASILAGRRKYTMPTAA
jgi:hypothetical protein